MLEAWEAKQDRNAIRDASLQHLIALSGGLKKRNGGALSVEDFLPAKIRKRKRKTDPETSEARLKNTLKALAGLSKKPKQDGQ